MNKFVQTGFLAGLLLLLVPTNAAAQTTRSDIPQFRLWQTSGRTIGPAALPAGKPVVLIYFAPDCGHCTTLLNGVFKEINAFRHTTLLLATFKPAADLQAFERSYKTAAYSNIITGTEGNTFLLRNYYRMQRTPFVAFFEKNGKLVRTFSNEPTVQDLLGGLKLL